MESAIILGLPHGASGRLAGLVEDVQSLGFKVERAEDHPWPRDSLTRGAMRGVKRAYLGRPRIYSGVDSGGTGVSSLREPLPGSAQTPTDH